MIAFKCLTMYVPTIFVPQKPRKITLYHIFKYVGQMHIKLFLLMRRLRNDRSYVPHPVRSLPFYPPNHAKCSINLRIRVHGILVITSVLSLLLISKNYRHYKCNLATREY